MLLSSEQLAAGLATLDSGKLTPSQVFDLLSIFRGYLGTLAENYEIQSTLENEDDGNGLNARRCEKLAACLILFQENQFTPHAGFDPTAANRTGFVYSLDGENFEIFKYCFGLFWDVPKELTQKGSPRVSSQGSFTRTTL